MYQELLSLFASYMEKQEVLSRLTESEKLHGYNYSEIHTIAAIGNLEFPNVTSIAESMHMTRGAISKITKKLLEGKLITTYQLPENHQKIFYRLTEQGKLLYEEHEQRHNLWLARDQAFLKQYDEQYLKELQRFMKHFNHYLEEQIKSLGGAKYAD